MHAKAAVGALAAALGVITSQAQFQWTTNENEITITGTAGSIEADLRIPETMTGLPVTAIGPSAFYGNSVITNVVIADSVRRVGDTAFA